MAGLAAYLNLRPEQHWILALTAVVAAVSVEGAIRTHPDWRGGALATLGYALLPLLAVLAAGLFIDETVGGYGRLAAGVAAGAATGLLLYAEYHAIAPAQALFGPMRLLLAVGAYLVALALFTVVLIWDLPLPLSALIVGAISFVLALDLLRESRRQTLPSAPSALAIGLSLAELRVVLHYFPLNDLLEGMILGIGFYVATGFVHDLLEDDLTPVRAAEYLAVAGVITAVVVIVRPSL